MMSMFLLTHFSRSVSCLLPLLNNRPNAIKFESISANASKTYDKVSYSTDANIKFQYAIEALSLNLFCIELYLCSTLCCPSFHRTIAPPFALWTRTNRTIHFVASFSKSASNLSFRTLARFASRAFGAPWFLLFLWLWNLYSTSTMS